MGDEKRPDQKPEPKPEAEKMEDVRPAEHGLEDDAYDDESGVGNPHGYWEVGDY